MEYTAENIARVVMERNEIDDELYRILRIMHGGHNDISTSTFYIFDDVITVHYEYKTPMWDEYLPASCEVPITLLGKTDSELVEYCKSHNITQN